jgi:hypothetical protein
MEQLSAPWRKSTYSSANGGACVEAASKPGTVLVRDTTQRGHGPVLAVSAASWSKFVKSVKG